MENGASVFATTATMPPGPLARTLEERGHNALYFAEHTHLPVTEQTAALPHAFRGTCGPFVASTAAAAATHRLRVGAARRGPRCRRACPRQLRARDRRVAG
ncbi:hypothetical protein GCM10009799_00110 [Nocardiopsis rhodophaea]|uniref:Uncharacterized protein n=1 Tax=Nocardiopsis rhodophaea TaxID=280238 RepID=A0ABN2S1T3_9ACTN